MQGIGRMPPARSLNQRAVVCLHASAAPAGAQLQGQLLVNKCTRKQLKHTLKQHRKNLCAALQLEQRPEAALTGLLNDLRKLELYQPVPDTPGNECQVMQPSTSGRTTSAASITIVTPSGQPLNAALPDLDQLDLDSPDFAPRDYQTAGRVLVCQGSKCKAKGALGVLQAVSAVAGASDTVQVLPCKCLGKCKEGAVMRVKQEGQATCAVYTKLSPHDVPTILDSHFLTPSQPANSAAQVSGACCTDCKTGH